MTWTLKDQEFAAVLRLHATERYSYFIKKVADEERLWSLKHADGWALLGESDGRELVPVWPHARFAEAAAIGAFAGYRPQAISLEDWLEVWTPGMRDDNRNVAVFPTPDGKGPVVTADRLGTDLKEELERYE